MAKRRAAGPLLVVAALGCASSEGAPDASGGGSDRAVVAQMAELYDRALTHRCECLVAQDLIYDTVGDCLSSLGWDPSGEDCIADAFDEDGTDELRSALRCHVGHLDNANACSEAASCEELLIEGACDEASAASPCGQAAVDLYAFIFEHCPQLALHAQQ